MRVVPSLSRVTVALAAGLLAGVAGLSGGPASAAPQPAPIPFAADSGDACPYGSTAGTLTFHLTDSFVISSVDVSGAAADHPTLSDPSNACGDDGYYSTASFALRRGEDVLDSATRRVDNDRVEVDLTLDGSLPPTGSDLGADRVTVQVCRSPLPPREGTTYCGKTMTYRILKAG